MRLSASGPPACSALRCAAGERCNAVQRRACRGHGCAGHASVAHAAGGHAGAAGDFVRKLRGALWRMAASAARRSMCRSRPQAGLAGALVRARAPGRGRRVPRGILRRHLAAQSPAAGSARVCLAPDCRRAGPAVPHPHYPRGPKCASMAPKKALVPHRGSDKERLLLFVLQVALVSVSKVLTSTGSLLSGTVGRFLGLQLWCGRSTWALASFVRALLLRSVAWFAQPVVGRSHWVQKWSRAWGGPLIRRWQAIVGEEGPQQGREPPYDGACIALDLPGPPAGR